MTGPIYHEDQDTARKLIIFYDEFAENPREWEVNVGKIVCWTSPKYKIGDEQPSISVEDWLWELSELEEDATENAIWKAVNEKYMIMPVYMYDHSGIPLAVYPFTCPWDSGQIGYIYAERTPKIPDDKLRECLEGEISVYSDFLNGDVFGFCCIELVSSPGKRKIERSVETVGGFYGCDFKENGMIDYIPEEFHHLLP